MCLQWCHVQGWVIDNDQPCWNCPAYGQPPTASCDTCTHRREGKAGPMCALTKLALPYARSCCHHNANLTVTQIAVALDDLAVAPWVLALHHAATPAALLADHHSAPELELHDGQAYLRLDELAVPFVYGVTADSWEHAVAMPTPEPIPDAPPHFAVALEALEALQAGGDIGPAYLRLTELLEGMPLASLPDYWRGTIAETLNLLEEHHTP